MTFYIFKFWKIPLNLGSHSRLEDTGKIQLRRTVFAFAMQTATGPIANDDSV